MLTLMIMLMIVIIVTMLIYSDYNHYSDNKTMIIMIPSLIIIIEKITMMILTEKILPAIRSF